MKYLDYACAWILFLLGLAYIVDIEIWHLHGAVLDTPMLWVRLRNGYGVRNMKIFCVAANLMLLTLVIVGFKMYGPTVLIEGVPVTLETVFSLAQKAA